jgi:threonine dehydrogenase-like Zn-dependent dehydrogenase
MIRIQSISESDKGVKVKTVIDATSTDEVLFEAIRVVSPEGDGANVQMSITNSDFNIILSRCKKGEQLIFFMNDLAEYLSNPKLTYLIKRLMDGAIITTQNTPMA